MCSIICGREHTNDEQYDVKTNELAELKSSHAPLYQRAATEFSFPRVVVRDRTGRALDTFTSLQEAIYRAKWNVQTSRTAILPEEWRLPKAPLPSKPDYSRTAPLTSKSSKGKVYPRVFQSAPASTMEELDVEDVAYVAECLRQLPHLSHQDSFATGDKVYLEIVAHLLLHRKLLSETEKRDVCYEFPGFCKGCRRAGLCYACDKDSHPHIHKDKAMKTGGGFTFYQRDRPVHREHPDRTERKRDFYPVEIPAVELRQLLEDTTLSEAAKKALKKKLLAQYPWLQDIPFDHTTLDRLRAMGLLTEDGQTWKDKMEDEGIVAGDHEDSDLYRVSRSRLENWIAQDVVDSERSEKRSRRSREKRSVQAEVKVKVKEQPVEESADLSKEGTGTENAENNDKRPKLYQAPKPFKLREKQRRITVAESPFSTNRQLDVTKGPGFQIKKNEKQGTQFVEFNRSDANWKEPNRFQLKKEERKTTNFWVPKVGEKKKGKKEHDEYDYAADFKRNRKEIERPLSPDSGLASEIVSEDTFESETNEKLHRKDYGTTTLPYLSPWRATKRRPLRQNIFSRSTLLPRTQTLKPSALGINRKKNSKLRQASYLKNLSSMGSEQNWIGRNLDSAKELGFCLSQKGKTNLQDVENSRRKVEAAWCPWSEKGSSYRTSWTEGISTKVESCSENDDGHGMMIPVPKTLSVEFATLPDIKSQTEKIMHQTANCNPFKDVEKPLKAELYKKVLKDESLEDSLNDDANEKSFKDLLTEKSLKHETLDKLLKDESYRKPLKDESYEKPIKDEFHEKCFKDELYVKPLNDVTNENLLEDTLYVRQLSIYDNPLKDESNKNPLKNESYNTPLKADSYRKPLKDESNKKPLKDESYDTPLKDEWYKKPLEDESYDTPLKDEWYEIPLTDELYDRPLKEESYKMSLKDESYEKPLKDQTHHMPLKSKSNGKPLKLNTFNSLELNTDFDFVKKTKIPDIVSRSKPLDSQATPRTPKRHRNATSSHHIFVGTDLDNILKHSQVMLEQKQSFAPVVWKTEIHENQQSAILDSPKEKPKVRKDEHKRSSPKHSDPKAIRDVTCQEVHEVQSHDLDLDSGYNDLEERSQEKKDDLDESVKDSLTERDSTLHGLSATETEPSNLTLNDNELDSSVLESDTDLLRAESQRKERKPIVKKIRSPIPPRPKPVEKPPTPEPEPRTDVEKPYTPEPPSREATLTPVEDDPYTPNISMPDLPEFEVAKKEVQKKKSMKFFVAPPPELKEQPKKRKPPPKVRRNLKIKYDRKSQPAEAPVSSDKLQDIQDPLDFLAKYCIINPNRLPFYKLVFEEIIADQSPRYTNKKEKESKFSEHEKKLMRDLALLTRGHSDKIGLNPPEVYLEKICYTLEMIHDKMESLSLDLQEIDDRRLAMMAAVAREIFPGITDRDYTPPKKKKGKKGKKKKKADRDPSPCAHVRGEITDDIIIQRLTEDMTEQINKEPDIRQLNLERERTLEKITGLKGRLDELKGEKILADALGASCYFDDQVDNQKPDQFRRQQSQLYNTLRPDPDFELNLDELEDALQQINNHLLTDQEFKFLYFVLDLPGRRRINFRLFSVIAALSEKVTQLDPAVRKLINKFDYNALNVKMDMCKELFSLLIDDELSTPRGGASATSLALELTAGGLKPEHVCYVLNKFNREGKGMFDFMDFVTYIPLFIEIHQRIVKDPLREEQDL